MSTYASVYEAGKEEEMIKNKIQIMLTYRNTSQISLLDVLGMATRQSLNNKFSNNRFNVEDLIKICDYLGLEIVVRDKEKQHDVVIFDKDDLKK